MASARNKKAAEWIRGRKELFHHLEAAINPDDRVIWLHCASAGELEQGKPVIEALKKNYPDHKILLSLFSPSGYSVAKKYPGVDIITYLPADTRANAIRFVELARPVLVIFIKYEYWYHHLRAVSEKEIPLLLVSAIFRKDQVFFKKYGGFYRKMLSFFRQIFVQDKTSLELLHSVGIQHALVGGDTRFDRVLNISGNFSELPMIPEFIKGSEVIIAGSTWPEDEQLFASFIEQMPAKLILAPHEITPEHLESISKLFPDSIRYSKWKENPSAAPRVLIIDNIGMLSRLYHYATITYIGGGFNKSGIHNTLEAAVYSKPVLFGPNYQKFREAKDLVTCGGAFSISGSGDLKSIIDRLLNDPGKLVAAGEASKNYVLKNAGATQMVLQYIQENRLLTN